jgi:hypothetical protein
MENTLIPRLVASVVGGFANHCSGHSAGQPALDCDVDLKVVLVTGASSDGPRNGRSQERT